MTTTYSRKIYVAEREESIVQNLKKIHICELHFARYDIHPTFCNIYELRRLSARLLFLGYETTLKCFQAFKRQADVYKNHKLFVSPISYETAIWVKKDTKNSNKNTNHSLNTSCCIQHQGSFLDKTLLFHWKLLHEISDVNLF